MTSEAGPIALGGGIADGSTAFTAGYLDFGDDCLGVDANSDRAEPEFLHPRTCMAHHRRSGGPSCLRPLWVA